MATSSCPRDTGGKCSVVNEYNYTHDNGLIYTDNILLVAFQSILSDPDFDVPSQPAIAARKSASLILLWCTTHQDETSAFLSKLQIQLSTCFASTAKKLSTRKERMWELFFKVRSSPSFEDMWKEFLIACGTDASSAVYQHVTDIIFKDLLTKQFPAMSTQEVEASVQLDYNEKNALRYVGGYVTRVLHQRLKKSKHEKKSELCTCLTEMNDVDGDEMHDESDEWMDAIDRGGLKHITQIVYLFFVSIELALRNYLQGPDQPSLTMAKDKVIKDEGVQSSWSTIAVNWEDESATLLLNLIVDTWIKIRGHSTARAWLESYKLQQKKSVQKSKGIRKQLISSTSSASTSSE